jgi:hypothetical protein
LTTGHGGGIMSATDKRTRLGEPGKQAERATDLSPTLRT